MPRCSASGLLISEKANRIRQVNKQRKISEARRPFEPQCGEILVE